MGSGDGGPLAVPNVYQAKSQEEQRIDLDVSPNLYLSCQNGDDPVPVEHRCSFTDLF